MKNGRVDVGSIRREQIVEAAVAVIAEQGLQSLSLSEIEKRAGMSRGQLTYYFPAKEDILLAVFDRLLLMMHQRVQAVHGTADLCRSGGSAWERLEHFLRWVLLQPPSVPEFHALQYTFLSQIGHREDFRQRLAQLYEEWRAHMAGDFAKDLGPGGEQPVGDGGGPRPVSPRTVASFVQALLHGLAMQRAADPDAYDRQEMLELCLDLLGTYFRRPRRPRRGRTPRNRAVRAARDPNPRRDHEPT
jgi:AcrR family transcriptional regulator